jgi:hypothetical protein
MGSKTCEVVKPGTKKLWPGSAGAFGTNGGLDFFCSALKIRARVSHAVD